jgi:hypothetical protein
MVEIMTVIKNVGEDIYFHEEGNIIGFSMKIFFCKVASMGHFYTITLGVSSCIYLTHVQCVLSKFTVSAAWRFCRWKRDAFKKLS